MWEEKMNLFYDEFNEIYKLKTMNTRESVDKINEFCSKWDASNPKVEYIPYLMKLFYNHADTWAQNEFVSELIDSIMRRYPRETIETIINNVDILYKEEGERCLTFLSWSFEYVNKDYASIVAEALYNADEEKSKPFLDFFEKDSKESKKEAEKILELYQRLGKNRNK